MYSGFLGRNFLNTLFFPRLFENTWMTANENKNREEPQNQNTTVKEAAKKLAPGVAWIQMTLSTTQGMDSSEDRVRLLMKETIEFLRSHAFIFNFSNIKMVKDKILDQVPSGTFRGIVFGLYQSCDAFVTEDACRVKNW